MGQQMNHQQKDHKNMTFYNQNYCYYCPLLSLWLYTVHALINASTLLLLYTYYIAGSTICPFGYDTVFGAVKHSISVCGNVDGVFHAGQRPMRTLSLFTYQHMVFYS